MKRIFSVLFLFLCHPLAVWAVSESDKLDMQAIQSGAVQKSDVSMAYLSQIFGQVGGVLQNTTNSMMPLIVGKFNTGILIVASMIIAYGVVMMVFRASTEAAMMSANRNTYMIVARVAVGFALLIPLDGAAGGGYNALQVILMNVVSSSVKLADLTWSKSLDTLKLQQGQVVQEPINSATGSNPQDIDAFVKEVLYNDGASNVGFSDQPFLQKLSQVIICTRLARLRTGKNLIPYKSDNNEKIYFPSAPKSESGCGELNVKSITDRLNEAKKGATSYQDMASMLLDVIGNFAVVNNNVDNLFCFNNPGNAICNTRPSNSGDAIKTNETQLKKSLATALQFSFAALQNKVRAVNTKNNNNDDQNKDIYSFVQRAKDQGWATAGAFYWNLIRNKTVGANFDQVKYQGKINTNDLSASNTQSVGSFADFADNYDLGSLVSDAADTAKTKMGVANDSSAYGATGQSTPMGQGLLRGGSFVLKLLMGPVLGALYQVGLIYSKFSAIRMGLDPVVWLSSLGSDFLNLAADLFFLYLGTLMVNFTFASFRWTSYDMLKPVQAVQDWLRPIVMIACGALLMIGVTLQYMVPLYPFIVFTFGVISWFVMLIEAMFAMPLVALGVTHPEGHDFLGRAEQAVMLLLGVFLRPVLMVIGLIVGVILSHVALRFIIGAYSVIISDLFNPTGAAALPPSSGDLLLSSVALAWAHVMAQTNSIYGLFLRVMVVMPLMFYIFMQMIYSTVKACYNTIYIIPDYILRWVGGPQSASAIQPGRIADQMTQTVKGAVDQVQRMGKSLAENAYFQKVRELEARGEKTDEDDNKEDKKEDDVGLTASTRKRRNAMTGDELGKYLDGGDVEEAERDATKKQRRPAITPDALKKAIGGLRRRNASTPDALKEATKELEGSDKGETERTTPVPTVGGRKRRNAIIERKGTSSPNSPTPSTSSVDDIDDSYLTKEDKKRLDNQFYTYGKEGRKGRGKGRGRGRVRGRGRGRGRRKGGRGRKK